METWSAETIQAYYRDPEIVRLEAGYGSKGGVVGGPLTETGYYILHNCGRPECCRPEGPFATVEEAVEWSRLNLVEKTDAPMSSGDSGGGSPVIEEQIVEVGIDPDGKLYVRTRGQTFPHIYRAAMGIGWDPDRTVLFAPKPRDWSYLDWFRRISAAVADEYGVRLKLDATTVFSDIPDPLRGQLEADQARTD